MIDKLRRIREILVEMRKREPFNVGSPDNLLEEAIALIDEIRFEIGE